VVSAKDARYPMVSVVAIGYWMDGAEKGQSSFGHGAVERGYRV
jgi:hypothetical protein